MFYNQKVVGVVGIMLSVGLPISLLSVSLPVSSAETCRPLKVVGGQGAQVQVRKKISPPTVVPGVSSNFNTDFAVPPGVRFSRYVATIVAENEANYNITIYLKYNDNSSKEVYNGKDVHLRLNNPLKIRITPPDTRQPYQVNLLIRGVLNNTYQARVSACS